MGEVCRLALNRMVKAGEFSCPVGEGGQGLVKKSSEDMARILEFGGWVVLLLASREANVPVHVCACVGVNAIDKSHALIDCIWVGSMSVYVPLFLPVLARVRVRAPEFNSNLRHLNLN